MAESPPIQLYVKASDDAESVGNCPFSQRLFMILWLKGAPFILTTVDMKRAPDVLKDLAPGSQPPFLTYKGELKTDTNKIEEFLEQTLAPPQYPKLSCQYKTSINAGEDIFRTFSAYIRNPSELRYKKFLTTLVELNTFLTDPLPYELDKYPQPTKSERCFLDGDTLTLADCNLLPKLNIVKVVCLKYLGWQIGDGLEGLKRYLDNAYKRDEFRYTCPNDEEIIHAYCSVAKHLKNSMGDEAKHVKKM